MFSVMSLNVSDSAVFFKKHNRFTNHEFGVLCHGIKRGRILSLCEPRTLFKWFNYNPIDSGTKEPQVLQCDALPCLRLQSDIIVPTFYTLQTICIESMCLLILSDSGD